MASCIRYDRDACNECAKKQLRTVENDSSSGRKHNDAKDRESNGGSPAHSFAEEPRQKQHAGDDDEACLR